MSKRKVHWLPDGTTTAWVRNARFGGYQLEADGTLWSVSVASEAYWQD